MGVAETKRRHEDTETEREVNREGKRRNLQQREGEGSRQQRKREGAFELPVAVRISALLHALLPPSPVERRLSALQTRTRTRTEALGGWTRSHTPGVWSSAENEPNTRTQRHTWSKL